MQNTILRMNKLFFKIFTLTIGFSFLYFPILTLIAYSFNDNKRVMVWKGFSFRWYKELFQNEQILEAFYTSIKIASLSATFATIMGVMIGFSLTRISKIPKLKSLVENENLRTDTIKFCAELGSKF